MSASVPDEDKLPQLLLKRRLEAFSNASPIAVLPTLSAILVIVVIYFDRVEHGLLFSWAVTAAAVMVLRIIAGLPLRAVDLSPAGLSRRWRRMTMALIFGSTAWAGSLILAAALFPGELQVEFSIIAAVLFSGVLLLHRTAPEAAVYHIVALGCALGFAQWAAFGWASWPMAVVIACFATTLIAAVHLQDRHFRGACVAEVERGKSESTVRMLLNEHEAQAADWLWTIGEGAALREVSHRLADLFRTTPVALEGTSLLSLIDPGPGRDHIAGLIAQRAAFRDEPVHVTIDGERRVWRLSGRPQSGGRMSGVGRDVTDQHRIEDRVRTMAYIDPLTGLANRHLFNQRLRELLEGDGGRPQAVALLYLDLDDFKAVNDLHGHPFGDMLLRELGARLRAVSREGDMVARLGGDEFAILVEKPAGDGILIDRAHRLLAAAREPFLIDGQVARISTSIGIARAASGGDAVDLMRRVDLALYAAKGKGRDQLALFDDALDQRARERSALENELREAVERDELALFYQPVISLQSGETVGYEALLRWRHPERGLMLPDSFLPIAEDSGLIMGLGDWVIRQALADAAEWRGEDFRLSLNLSSSQIRNPLLFTTVERALGATGFPARRLEFEITEHVLLKDSAHGAEMLTRLRSLGAEIALDDFGTGYSSLSYLRRFRFDRIKIDRSFVADIASSDEAQAIVSTITRLASVLGMHTTAEGVERPEQLDLLRKLGCDEAQGFLILEPVPAATIAESRRLGEDFPLTDPDFLAYREARRSLLAKAPARSQV